MSRRTGWAAALCVLGVVSGWNGQVAAQTARPSEADLFGGDAPEPEREAEPPGTERPDENALFGAPTTETPAAEEARPPAATPSPADDPRDDLVLGQRNASPRLSLDVAPTDPLAIGGQIYLRTLSSARERQDPDDWSFSTPTLVDAYFDARPNDRVRGFVLGRMAYDPTLAESAAANRATGQVAGTGSVQGSPSLSTLFQAPTRGPRVILDQLWLRFDLGHRVFVTAGKQHVRWGTARFWMPGDFLHIRRRNPLDVFDARAGTTMLKFHLPVEDLGWNFYAYAVTESATTTPTIGAVAGAARAEFVLGQSELGMGAFLQADQKPRLEADFSTGIGAFDLYGELALRSGNEIDRVRFAPNAPLPALPPRQPWQSEAEWGQLYVQDAVEALYPVVRRNGYKAQAVGGFTYQRQYADRDVFTLGAEYFYNPLGYDEHEAYLGLVLPRNQPLMDPATFFYLGRHYAAVFAALPAPYNLDLHSFVFSTLGNLSDQSFISRFDYTYTLLTHVRFEAFASVRYGRSDGEFRFGVSSPAILGQRLFELAPSIFDFGLALRVAI